MSAVYVRLKELRLALGLSQTEIAARAGIRRATVSRIENAQISSIDLRVLEKLADVLAVDPGFLLSRVRASGGNRGKEKSAARRSGEPRD